MLYVSTILADCHFWQFFSAGSKRPKRTAKTEFIVDATIIPRMMVTTVFSRRTDFSVLTGGKLHASADIVEKEGQWLFVNLFLLRRQGFVEDTEDIKTEVRGTTFF
jgi:hypothetical protein